MIFRCERQQFRWFTQSSEQTDLFGFCVKSFGRFVENEQFKVRTRFVLKPRAAFCPGQRRSECKWDNWTVSRFVNRLAGGSCSVSGTTGPGCGSCPLIAHRTQRVKMHVVLLRPVPCEFRAKSYFEKRPNIIIRGRSQNILFRERSIEGQNVPWLGVNAYCG